MRTLQDVLAVGVGEDEAVRDGRTALSWAALRDRVGRLAAALAGVGVRPGDRVGVHVHKSVDTMVAVHGVLWAGAVVVPLDPLAPAGHLARLLADCAVEVVVTDAAGDQLAALRRAAGAFTAIGPAADADADGDGDTRTVPWAAVAEHDPAAPVPVAPDAPAYVMYTSGSTGRPKGIVHTHRSGLAYARHAAATYGLGPADRMANIAPLHFDQSTFEMFAGPLAGASVVTVPEPVLRFPASLAELVEREAVTVWYSVPYLLTQLLERGAIDQRDLSAIRWVLFGGEVLPPAVLARLMRALPGARFSNVYGPAEVNQCTYHHVPAPPADDEPVPIGRPWVGAEILVVDDAGRPVPDGDRGELLVHTDTAMAGYWGQPEATAAAFASLPDAAGHVRRWYRTGDIVSARADGELVFWGRADHQVKVRGHRVELEAVEAVVARLPEVAQVAVVDVADVLVALVVGAGGPVDGRLLRTSVGAQLPAHAVPSEVIEVDRIPRTASDKIDRRAARALVEAHSELRIRPSSVHHRRGDAPA